MRDSRTSEDNGFPLARIQRLTEAIESIAGVRVEFLDASGVPSVFNRQGLLIPTGSGMQLLSPAVLQEACGRPRPLLHRTHEPCAAASVPFLIDGRLAGFVTVSGFSLPQPDEHWAAALRERFVIEGWRDIFGGRDMCEALDFERFLALIDLLEGATAQITLLCGKLGAGSASDTTTPLSWAVSSALEELTRAAGTSGELSDAVKARDRLEALYNSTQDAILMLDRELTIVAANREFGRVFGTDADAFLGVSGTWLRRWVMKNAKDQAKVATSIDRLLSDPTAVIDDEVELLSPRYMILRFYSAPVMDKAQQVIGRVLMFRDITEFRRARQELIGTEKMDVIGRAAAGMAHELNNILAGVVTYADYALEVGTFEKIREALKMSMAAAEKASALVGEFLAATGPAETFRQDIDLHLEIERLMDSMEPELRKDNIRVHRLLESVPRINADPLQMLKVFHHLVDNARQAIAKEGTIAVRTETDWDRGVVRIIVTDSGPGIPGEVLDRIFDPFFTTRGVVSGGANTASKGLGLSIAKGIIEAHGGKIYAGNVLPHGASFVVELPLPGERVEEPPSPSMY